ncbi:11106_t:CDS:2, partial [Funneliformis caledonium]
DKTALVAMKNKEDMRKSVKECDNKTIDLKIPIKLGVVKDIIDVECLRGFKGPEGVESPKDPGSSEGSDSSRGYDSPESSVEKIDSLSDNGLK